MLKLLCTFLLFLFFLPFVGCVQHQSTIALEDSITNTGGRGITVKKIKQLLDNKKTFKLIDSSSKGDYARSHLPTAISMPACEGQKHLELLPEEKDQLLVFYCGWSGCSMNTQAATTAAQADYTNIRFMKGGVEGWIKAGFPTHASDNFIHKGHCILIDLRPAHKDTVQRIPRSVSIPFPTLMERIDVLSKRAVVVVYSDHAQESRDALAKLSAAGFTKVSMVEGNFQGWKQRGNQVTSGPIVTTVSWTPEPVAGEVTLVEFNNALNGKVNAVLLDVRTSEEVATGKLLKTLHIPLKDLVRRKKELPKDKKIFIYCTSGLRADMASRVLRRNGYTSFALSATLECEGGDCELTN